VQLLRGGVVDEAARHEAQCARVAGDIEIELDAAAGSVVTAVVVGAGRGSRGRRLRIVAAGRQSENKKRSEGERQPDAAAPAEIVQIMAAIQNVPRTANLSVNAATPAGPTLASVSTVPTSLTGGSSATGTVTFTGTTDGADVDLSSSNPAVLQVPPDVVVNGGARSGAFAISTSAVSAPTTVTITARRFGITRTTTVTVSPGAPAPADRVAIKKARWKAGLLTIEATSTNPNAILSVFGRSGFFMFTLTNNGGGRFSDQRGFITNPVAITVRSNFGGAATATLSN